MWTKQTAHQSTGGKAPSKQTNQEEQKQAIAQRERELAEQKAKYEKKMAQLQEILNSQRGKQLEAAGVPVYTFLSRHVYDDDEEGEGDGEDDEGGDEKAVGESDASARLQVFTDETTLSPEDQQTLVKFRELITKKKIYMADAEDMGIWNAYTVLPYKNGFLFIHPR